MVKLSKDKIIMSKISKVLVYEKKIIILELYKMSCNLIIC